VPPHSEYLPFLHSASPSILCGAPIGGYSVRCQRWSHIPTTYCCSLNPYLPKYRLYLRYYLTVVLQEFNCPPRDPRERLLGESLVADVSFHSNSQSLQESFCQAHPSSPPKPSRRYSTSLRRLPPRNVAHSHWHHPERILHCLAHCAIADWDKVVQLYK
jgi:hypothetical protein